MLRADMDITDSRLDVALSLHYPYSTNEARNTSERTNGVLKLLSWNFSVMSK